MGCSIILGTYEIFSTSEVVEILKRRCDTMHVIIIGGYADRLR